MLLQGMLVIMLLSGLALLPPARAESASSVRVVSDIAYYTGDDADPLRHRLDLYIPQDLPGFPLLIYAHGGAWVGGSKDSYANIGQAFAQAGIGVAVINYRLSPGATHPAHIEDMARAFAWAGASIADYGGDPARIFASGHSAGGQLASLLVLDPQWLAAHDLTPQAVAGVIAFSGVYSIDDWIMQWARGAFPDDPALRETASPLWWAQNFAAGDQTPMPPFLLLAGEDDYPELLLEQEAMHATLLEAGFDAQAAVIAGRSHFGLVTAIGSPDDPTTAQVLAWVSAVLAQGDR